MMRMQSPNFLLLTTLALLLAGCAPTPVKQTDPLAPLPQTTPQNIPAPVTQVPALPPPTAREPLATYSVVVTDVPVKDMLFALARDAGLNIDVHPGVNGQVTLNAIDQTLPQILERIERQVDIRITHNDDTLYIAPDTPYLHTYKIDYLNISRDNTANVSVATQIATTGASAVGGDAGSGGNNNSTTMVSSVSRHHFWDNLVKNVGAIIGIASGDESSEAAASTAIEGETAVTESVSESRADGSETAVMASPETGLLTVRASARQHREVQQYLDTLLVNAQRQVLIEATVVEVTLNDNYQLGVDWRLIANNGGWSIDQSLTGTNFSTAPFTALTYSDPQTERGSVTNTIRMLREFGDVKVLSSPKIMAINNQAALLKVVDNLVYFTLEADTSTSEGVVTTTFSSEVHTVPIGFVMSVTPQVSESDTVILNVRPTISRVISFILDPNPSLAAVNVESRVPQIQVREMDSILRIQSGQTAVLGGLIQDSLDLNNAGTPFMSEVPVIGNMFSYRNNQISRNELVIFLRPRVIRDANTQTELADFNRYLPAEQPVSGTPQRLTKPPFPSAPRQAKGD